jgi:hypothetical protein
MKKMLLLVADELRPGEAEEGNVVQGRGWRRRLVSTARSASRAGRWAAATCVAPPHLRPPPFRRPHFGGVLRKFNLKKSNKICKIKIKQFLNKTIKKKIYPKKYELGKDQQVAAVHPDGRAQ